MLVWPSTSAYRVAGQQHGLANHNLAPCSPETTRVLLKGERGIRSEWWFKPAEANFLSRAVTGRLPSPLEGVRRPVRPEERSLARTACPAGSERLPARATRFPALGDNSSYIRVVLLGSNSARPLETIPARGSSRPAGPQRGASGPRGRAGVWAGGSGATVGGERRKWRRSQFNSLDAPTGSNSGLGAPGGPVRAPSFAPSPSHSSSLESGPGPDAPLGRAGAEGRPSVRSRRAGAGPLASRLLRAAQGTARASAHRGQRVHVPPPLGWAPSMAN